MRMITLDEVLKMLNWNEADVVKIYYGKSHCCRCGCKGNYFKVGERGFKRHLNALKRGIQLAHEFKCDDINAACYVNIDIANTNDRCICLYCED